MRLSLFAVCAISAVAIRLPATEEDSGVAFNNQVDKIFSYTDKNKDGALSNQELSTSFEKGVKAGTIPQEAVPVVSSAISNQTSAGGNAASKAGLCNRACLQGALTETFEKMGVNEDQRAPIL